MAILTVKRIVRRRVVRGTLRSLGIRTTGATSQLQRWSPQVLVSYFLIRPSCRCGPGTWQSAPVICKRSCGTFNGPRHIATCNATLLNDRMVDADTMRRYVTFPQVPDAMRNALWRWDIASGTVGAWGPDPCLRLPQTILGVSVSRFIALHSTFDAVDPTDFGISPAALQLEPLHSYWAAAAGYCWCTSRKHHSCSRCSSAPAISYHKLHGDCVDHSWGQSFSRLRGDSQAPRIVEQCDCSWSLGTRS